MPPSETKDVPWLAEAQAPPQAIEEADTGYFAPLLVDSGGNPIRDLTGWRKKRKGIRADWQAFLGPMPQERPPVRLEVLAEDRPEGIVRQRVRYESEAGEPVEGYLLRPDPLPEERTPGIVALHPTSKDTIEEIAGVTGRESQALGPILCREGFAVFCPRCFLWQSASDYQEALDRFFSRHPRTSGMHKMLYDAVRGVDALASLPYVDPERIGSAGHSLGAKESLYLAAFDERVKASVASEGGVGFRYTNWEAPWYLGNGIYAPDFPLNHHQLLALIAPRAMLVLAGESGDGAADGSRTWPYIEAALPVYALWNRPARLGLYNHGQGHSIPPDALSRLIEWLKAYTA
ncbi:MAG: dienelactone hydrolase family protein [Armatimonadetes bacterium]|nr:dienelactone hydrolase family protein [Armatimonadota bacterium]